MCRASDCCEALGRTQPAANSSAISSTLAVDRPAPCNLLASCHFLPLAFKCESHSVGSSIRVSETIQHLLSPAVQPFSDAHVDLVATDGGSGKHFIAQLVLGN
jgi:hypothetical protein